MPEPIFDREVLAGVPQDCVLIDLASPPGGIDSVAASELGVKTIWATALPGKYAPESAASYLAKTVFATLESLIVKLATEIPGLEVNNPQGAFYLFPKCSSFFGKKDGDRVINNSTDLAMYLLEVGHVATVGGDAFGSPECFRMSYATSDENITEALRRIKETLARLK